MQFYFIEKKIGSITSRCSRERSPRSTPNSRLDSWTLLDQYRYIKIQSQTIDLRPRLWGINPTNSVFIPQSLVVRSIVWGWILIYRNWSICKFISLHYKSLMLITYFWSDCSVIFHQTKGVCPPSDFKIVKEIQDANKAEEEGKREQVKTLKLFVSNRSRYICIVGVSNGHIQFERARKIWPLLELLAKIRCVLACSCSQKFCKFSHAQIFVKIACRAA